MSDIPLDICFVYEVINEVFGLDNFRLLISFVEGKESLWKGYLYAVLMLAVACLQTLILSQYFHRMFLVGLRIRTALISAIYRKVRDLLQHL
jgi:hypothetical protein